MADSVVDKLKDALEGVFDDKKTLIRIISVVIILLIALILRIHDENKADITIETAETPDEIEYNEESSVSSTSQVIFVDISGAVEKPGVYEVSKDTRLFQVIELAGGLSEDADPDSVNRASFVEDGQKIIIPVKGGDNAGELPILSAAPEASGSGLVNINTATADELKTLNGIGDVMAERIIEFRSSETFKSKEDIMSVDGIGSRTYEKIKDRITV
ncbi:MAG: helix-hairpin-helix domain-containing protein [Mogibacterium sp.]|nr:helix-hairpin-helix domain-containing protein [Mogibacterium sp.]